MAPAAKAAEGPVEKELNRLRRLPENRICPNCQKKDTVLGFTAVVVPFRTFVCSDCKSAHQAFSHRCKSVTMSNWSMDEVKMLDEANHGGNRIAIERWLASVPEGTRPRSDGPQDVLKQFIDRAYNQKVWEGAPRQSMEYGSPSPPPKASRTHTSPASSLASSPSPRASVPVIAQAVDVVKQQPPQQPSATVNLLDDMFETTPSAQSSASTAGGLFDGLAQAGGSAPTGSLFHGLAQTNDLSTPAGGLFDVVQQPSASLPPFNATGSQAFFDPFSAPSGAGAQIGVGALTVTPAAPLVTVSCFDPFAAQPLSPVPMQQWSEPPLLQQQAQPPLAQQQARQPLEQSSAFSFVHQQQQQQPQACGYGGGCGGGGGGVSFGSFDPFAAGGTPTASSVSTPSYIGGQNSSVPAPSSGNCSIFPAPCQQPVAPSNVPQQSAFDFVQNAAPSQSAFPFVQTPSTAATLQRHAELVASHSGPSMPTQHQQSPFAGTNRQQPTQQQGACFDMRMFDPCASLAASLQPPEPLCIRA